MTEFLLGVIVGMILGINVYVRHLKRRQRLTFTAPSGTYSVGIKEVNQDNNVITLGLDYRKEKKEI